MHRTHARWLHCPGRMVYLAENAYGAEGIGWEGLDFSVQYTNNASA
jgi:hypothetical protein